MKKIDLTGKRFGNLVVQEEAYSQNGVYWLCVCDCGNIALVKTSRLNAGTTKSCGCLLKASQERFAKDRFKHGKWPDALFTVWCDMIRRCYVKNRPDYKNYGGRGIRVCKRWRENFKYFLDDMGDCPKGLTLERINTNGDYEPTNCKWATRTEQNRNARTSKRWHIKGKVFKSASLAGKYFGVNHVTIIRWCQSKLKQDCYSIPLYPENELCS